jgi:D-hydroxyproline dehydrogenase subunit alpha
VTGETVTVDVAVVGAGPAGMAAAVAAREAGVSVALIDRYPAVGGQIWKRPYGDDSPPSDGSRLADRLTASGSQVLLETAVWGVSDENTLLTEGAVSSVRARKLVLATGAYDRPVAFPGWTLPGVFTAGAAQTLVKAQATLPGRQVLLAGAGPFLLPVATQLAKAGAEVTVAEATRRGSWLRTAPRMLPHLRRAAEYAAYRVRLHGIRFMWGRMLVRAEGAGRVERATLAQVDAGWRPQPGSERTLEVDAVCTAYGFLPALELARALGCELDGDAVAHDDEMRTSVENVYVAGEAAGVGGAELAVLEGSIAGSQAAAARVVAGAARRRRRHKRFAGVMDDLFRPGPGLHELPDADTVLCRCEDITARQVDEAIARGATSLSAIKIATRCGQGPCQGRMCENAVAARLPAPGGRFSSRIPVRPVALKTLAGDVTADSS